MGWWLGDGSIDLLRARRAMTARMLGEIGEQLASGMPVERCTAWHSDAERAYAARLRELHGLLVATTRQLESAVSAIDRSIAGAGGPLPGR